MTDYRDYEIAATLEEARQSTIRGCLWYALALALVVASGATATSSHTLSVALAVWACPALYQAARWWRAASDDREIAAWMGGAA